MYSRRNQNTEYLRPDGMFNVIERQWRAAQANQSRHSRECGNPGSLFRDPWRIPCVRMPRSIWFASSCTCKVDDADESTPGEPAFVHHEGQEETLKASRPPIIPALAGIQWRRWARLVTGAPDNRGCLDPRVRQDDGPSRG